MQQQHDLTHRSRIDYYLPVTFLFILLCQLLTWYSIDWGSQTMDTLGIPATLLTIGYLIAVRPRKLLLPMKVACLYLGWYMLTRFLNADFFLESSYYNLVVLSIAICIALPLDTIIGDKHRKTIETVVGTAIILFFAAIACVGLYAAVTGKSILLPLATFPIEINQELRLSIWNKHPNISAALFSVSLLLSLYLAANRRHKWLAIPYLMAALCLYAGISLTASRTAMIGIAVGLGLTGAFVVAKLVAKHKPLARYTLVLVATAVVLFSAYQGFGVAVDAMSAVSAKITATTAQPNAQADTTTDDTEESVAAKRDIAPGVASFGGRIGVYRAVLKYLPAYPTVLVTGGLDDAFMAGINEYTTFHYYHLHNSLLQVLLTVGVPGLALMIWFLVLLGMGSIKMIFGTGFSIAERILALIPMITIAHSMLEPFIFANNDTINILFFLSAGWVIQHSSAHKTANT